MSEDIRKWTDGKYTLMFDEHTFFVWDNEKEKRMTALQVTKKLNEQQEQIEQLHLAIDDLLSHTSCDEIKKENEQLRNELNDCEKFRYAVFKKMGEIDKNQGDVE